MNKILRCGLIGAGRIGKRHAWLLTEGKIPWAELKAVCDIQEQRLLKFGNEYGKNSYSDMHKMVADENLDLLVVATESGNHARNVIELAKYKIPIMIEKPMALTVDDADEMIRVCDENNVKLFVIKQNRFNVPVVKLKQALDLDKFGKIFLGTIRVRWHRDKNYYAQDDWRGTWKLDGGVLAQQASHHVDLLRWCLGDVESVVAYGNTTPDINIEVENVAVVILKFTNGALGIIEATTAVEPENLEGSLSIMGNKGTVVIDGIAVNKMSTWKFKNEKEFIEKEILEKYSENPPDVYGFGHIAYYNHVVDCLNNNSPQLVDGLEGRKSVELINAIYESIETGKEVSIVNRYKNCRLGKK